MKRYFFTLFKSFSSLLIFCLVIVPAQGEERIVVCGTGDSQSLLRDLAKEYIVANPGNQIAVPDSIGSGGGIKATAKGRCTLGRVARYLKKSEKKYNLNYELFAYTPVAFAVHKSVKMVRNLTGEQIVSIYSGKTTNWKEIGGEPGKIFVANRESGDSARTILEKKVAGFKNIPSFAGEILFSTPDMIATIAKYQNTIGYVPLAMTKSHDVNVLKINGIEPLPENIYSKKYPFIIPLGIVWQGTPTGLAKDFLEFILSSKGKSIIIKNGSVPVK